LSQEKNKYNIRWAQILQKKSGWPGEYHQHPALTSQTITNHEHTAEPPGTLAQTSSSGVQCEMISLEPFIKKPGSQAVHHPESKTAVLFH
jgi:hypothetical protein